MLAECLLDVGIGHYRVALWCYENLLTAILEIAVGAIGTFVTLHAMNKLLRMNWTLGDVIEAAFVFVVIVNISGVGLYLLVLPDPIPFNYYVDCFAKGYCFADIRQMRHVLRIFFEIFATVCALRIGFSASVFHTALIVVVLFISHGAILVAVNILFPAVG